MTGGDDKSDGAVAKIERAAERARKAREKPPPSPLRGLGTFGMIGWAVAVPSIGGVFLGLWLDRTVPQGFSWTVALLLGGAIVGAILAWRWVMSIAQTWLARVTARLRSR